MASIARRPDGTYRPRYRDADGKEHARHFKRKTDAQRWLDEAPPPSSPAPTSTRRPAESPSQPSTPSGLDHPHAARGRRPARGRRRAVRHLHRRLRVRRPPARRGGCAPGRRRRLPPSSDGGQPSGAARTQRHRRTTRTQARLGADGRRPRPAAHPDRRARRAVPDCRRPGPLALPHPRRHATAPEHRRPPVAQGALRGRPDGLAAARPPALLRLRAHRLRLRRRHRAAGPRTRLGDHDAEHLRTPVARRGRPHPGRHERPDVRSTRQSCGLCADWTPPTGF
jgi:hypothetical protein